MFTLFGRGRSDEQGSFKNVHLVVVESLPDRDMKGERREAVLLALAVTDLLKS